MSHIQGTDYVGSMVVHGGRPAQEERVPPLQGQGRRTATTTSPPWRRCSPAASPPTWPSATGRWPSARASSPTRRSCCWSTAARASSAWPSGCSRSSASTRRSRWRRWPSGSRRSTCPARPTRSAIPRQSEALYLLQRIRDEAHRFAITFHRELRGKRMTTSVLDDDPRARADAPKRLVKELGGVTAVQARRRSTSCRRCRGCPTRSADAVYEKAPRTATSRCGLTR